MLGNTHRALEVTEAQQFAWCHFVKYEELEWDPRSIVQALGLEIVNMDLALMLFS
jgi:hypothetical protein